MPFNNSDSASTAANKFANTNSLSSFRQSESFYTIYHSKPNAVVSSKPLSKSSQSLSTATTSSTTVDELIENEELIKKLFPKCRPKSKPTQPQANTKEISGSGQNNISKMAEPKLFDGLLTYSNNDNNNIPSETKIIDHEASPLFNHHQPHHLHQQQTPNFNPMIRNISKTRIWKFMDISPSPSPPPLSPIDEFCDMSDNKFHYANEMTLKEGKDEKPINISRKFSIKSNSSDLSMSDENIKNNNNNFFRKKYDIGSLEMNDPQPDHKISNFIDNNQTEKYCYQENHRKTTANFRLDNLLLSPDEQCDNKIIRDDKTVRKMSSIEYGDDEDDVLFCRNNNEILDYTSSIKEQRNKISNSLPLNSSFSVKQNKTLPQKKISEDNKNDNNDEGDVDDEEDEEDEDYDNDQEIETSKNHSKMNPQNHLEMAGGKEIFCSSRTSRSKRRSMMSKSMNQPQSNLHHHNNNNHHHHYYHYNNNYHNSKMKLSNSTTTTNNNNSAKKIQNKILNPNKINQLFTVDHCTNQIVTATAANNNNNNNVSVMGSLLLPQPSQQQQQQKFLNNNTTNQSYSDLKQQVNHLSINTSSSSSSSSAASSTTACDNQSLFRKKEQQHQQQQQSPATDVVNQSPVFVDGNDDDDQSDKQLNIESHDRQCEQDENGEKKPSASQKPKSTKKIMNIDVNEIGSTKLFDDVINDQSFAKNDEPIQQFGSDDDDDGQKCAKIEPQIDILKPPSSSVVRKLSCSKVQSEEENLSSSHKEQQPKQTSECDLFYLDLKNKLNIVKNSNHPPIDECHRGKSTSPKNHHQSDDSDSVKSNFSKHSLDSEDRLITRVIGSVPIAQYEGSPKRYGPKPGYPKRIVASPPSSSNEPQYVTIFSSIKEATNNQNHERISTNKKPPLISSENGSPNSTSTSSATFSSAEIHSSSSFSCPLNQNRDGKLARENCSINSKQSGLSNSPNIINNTSEAKNTGQIDQNKLKISCDEIVKSILNVPTSNDQYSENEEDVEEEGTDVSISLNEINRHLKLSSKLNLDSQPSLTNKINDDLTYATLNFVGQQKDSLLKSRESDSMFQNTAINQTCFDDSFKNSRLIMKKNNGCEQLSKKFPINLSKSVASGSGVIEQTTSSQPTSTTEQNNSQAQSCDFLDSNSGSISRFHHPPKLSSNVLGLFKTSHSLESTESSSYRSSMDQYLPKQHSYATLNDEPNYLYDGNNYHRSNMTARNYFNDKEAGSFSNSSSNNNFEHELNTSSIKPPTTLLENNDADDSNDQMIKIMPVLKDGLSSGLPSSDEMEYDDGVGGEECFEDDEDEPDIDEYIGKFNSRKVIGCESVVGNTNNDYRLRKNSNGESVFGINQNGDNNNICSYDFYKKQPPTGADGQQHYQFNYSDSRHHLVPGNNQHGIFSTQREINSTGQQQQQQSSEVSLFEQQQQQPIHSSAPSLGFHASLQSQSHSLHNSQPSNTLNSHQASSFNHHPSTMTQAHHHLESNESINNRTPPTYEKTRKLYHFHLDLSSEAGVGGNYENSISNYNNNIDNEKYCMVSVPPRSTSLNSVIGNHQTQQTKQAPPPPPPLNGINNQNTQRNNKSSTVHLSNPTTSPIGPHYYHHYYHQQSQSGNNGRQPQQQQQYPNLSNSPTLLSPNSSHNSIKHNASLSSSSSSPMSHQTVGDVGNSNHLHKSEAVSTESHELGANSSSTSANIAGSNATTSSSKVRQHDDDCDTDQETDRLLGSQRNEERGYYEEKSSVKRSNTSREVRWEPKVLIEGVLFRARYLGSTQLVCDGQPTKATRMMQAEEAVSRIKAPEGETQPSTEVDLFISTEKIMVLNTDLKEIMMDHALRTISYIADIGDLLVLMARRRSQIDDQQDSLIKRTPKMICHVFESEEAQYIAQSIGQAFQVAYMEFLKANGIKDSSFLKEMDYQEVLNSQEIFGDELEMFSKREKQKEVIVPKQKGEILGIVIVESGWGSMLPTVVIANLAQNSPSARCGQLNIGDQIIAINGISLVGLPLSTCQNYVKNTKNQTAVKFTIVPCPPVVEVKIKRPDTKYQLGFSVQNGVICSLLRGGIAERGGVRVGHRIIEINGQSVVAVPHDRIVNLLATSVGEILMKTMPTSMFRLLTGQESPSFM